MKKTTALRRLLEQPGAIIAPGAYDALSARCIAEAGFPLVYVSGAGIANTQFAIPDVGLTTLTEVVTQVGRICDAVPVPVIADADNGYGNAINLMRCVREFEKAGAAGIQLEDQEFPKRCGHFSGKRVVPTREAVLKIEAAVAARRDPDFVIVARTDALAVNGLDDAVDRARQYAAAGADVIFIEAPRTIAELRAAATAVAGKPHCANMVEGGLTPILSQDELREMGFKIIIYANAALRAGLFAIQGILKDLYQQGTSAGWLDRMISMAERKRLTGLPETEALEQRYLPEV